MPKSDKMELSKKPLKEAEYALQTFYRKANRIARPNSK